MTLCDLVPMSRAAHEGADHFAFWIWQAYHGDLSHVRMFEETTCEFDGTVVLAAADDDQLFHPMPKSMAHEETPSSFDSGVSYYWLLDSTWTLVGDAPIDSWH